MQKRKVYAAFLFVAAAMGTAMLAASEPLLWAAGGVLVIGGGLLGATLLWRMPGRTVQEPAMPKMFSESKRIAELEALYRMLQDNYFRKTNELQDKIDDLERFHRLAIGRELRLIELKSEVGRLKAAAQAEAQPQELGS